MSSASHGQSVETTVAQVVADELGVDFDDVTVIQGDTAGTPSGRARAAAAAPCSSSGAATRRPPGPGKMLEIAAHALEAAPEDLEVAAGRISVVGTPSHGMTITEVAAPRLPRPDQPARRACDWARGAGPLHARAPFTWSNSCHACICEVDAVTGAVTILRYVVSEDCGVMINPDVVEGQIAGGVVQGIGGVLTSTCRTTTTATR